MLTSPLEPMEEAAAAPVAEADGLESLAKGLEVAKEAPKADAGTSRLPLAFLPPGTRSGDRISLTVVGIDGINGTATVVADSPDNAVAPVENKKDIVDTSLTMGPMDDLKSYLYQKTMSQGA